MSNKNGKIQQISVNKESSGKSGKTIVQAKSSTSVQSDGKTDGKAKENGQNSERQLAKQQVPEGVLRYPELILAAAEVQERNIHSDEKNSVSVSRLSEPEALRAHPAIMPKEVYMAKQNKIFQELTGEANWKQMSDKNLADELKDPSLNSLVEALFAQLDEDVYNEFNEQKHVMDQIEFDTKKALGRLSEYTSDSTRLQFLLSNYGLLKGDLSKLEIEFLRWRRKRLDQMSSFVDNAANDHDKMRKVIKGLLKQVSSLENNSGSLREESNQMRLRTEKAEKQCEELKAQNKRLEEMLKIRNTEIPEGQLAVEGSSLDDIKLQAARLLFGQHFDKTDLERRSHDTSEKNKRLITFSADRSSVNSRIPPKNGPGSASELLGIENAVNRVISSIEKACEQGMKHEDIKDSDSTYLEIQQRIMCKSFAVALETIFDQYNMREGYIFKALRVKDLESHVYLAKLDGYKMNFEESNKTAIDFSKKLNAAEYKISQIEQHVKSLERRLRPHIKDELKDESTQSILEAWYKQANEMTKKFDALGKLLESRTREVISKSDQNEVLNKKVSTLETTCRYLQTERQKLKDKVEEFEKFQEQLSKKSNEPSSFHPNGHSAVADGVGLNTKMTENFPDQLKDLHNIDEDVPDEEYDDLDDNEQCIESYDEDDEDDEDYEDDEDEEVDYGDSDDEEVYDEPNDQEHEGAAMLHIDHRMVEENFRDLIEAGGNGKLQMLNRERDSGGYSTVEFFKRCFGFDITGMNFGQLLETYSAAHPDGCDSPDCPIHNPKSGNRVDWDRLMEEFSKYGPMGSSSSEANKGKSKKKKPVFGPPKPPPAI